LQLYPLKNKSHWLILPYRFPMGNRHY